MSGETEHPKHVPGRWSATTCPAMAKSDVTITGYYYCTLVQGHSGPHEAHGPLPLDRLVHSWEGQ